MRFFAVVSAGKVIWWRIFLSPREIWESWNMPPFLPPIHYAHMRWMFITRRWQSVQPSEISALGKDVVLLYSSTLQQSHWKLINVAFAAIFNRTTYSVTLLLIRLRFCQNGFSVVRLLSNFSQISTDREDALPSKICAACSERLHSWIVPNLLLAHWRSALFLEMRNLSCAKHYQMKWLFTG